MICSECALNHHAVAGVTVNDRWFCSNECVEASKIRPPKRVRGGKMSEEAKAALRKVIALRKRLVLSNISPTDLLIACDHYEEHYDPSFQPRPYNFTQPQRVRSNGRVVPAKFIKCRYHSRRTRSIEDTIWSGERYPYCFLRHATQEQITVLAERLKSWKIILPEHRRYNRGLSHVTTCFEFPAIIWILTKFHDAPVDVTKYVVALNQHIFDYSHITYAGTR